MHGAVDGRFLTDTVAARFGNCLPSLLARTDRSPTAFFFPVGRFLQSADQRGEQVLGERQAFEGVETIVEVAASSILQYSSQRAMTLKTALISLPFLFKRIDYFVEAVADSFSRFVLVPDNRRPPGMVCSRWRWQSKRQTFNGRQEA